MLLATTSYGCPATHHPLTHSCLPSTHTFLQAHPPSPHTHHDTQLHNPPSHRTDVLQMFFYSHQQHLFDGKTCRLHPNTFFFGSCFSFFLKTDVGANSIVSRFKLSLWHVPRILTQ